jgi:hypothetical protein
MCEGVKISRILVDPGFFYVIDTAENIKEPVAANKISL